MIVELRCLDAAGVEQRILADALTKALRTGLWGLAADDVTVNQVGVEGNQLLVADVVAIDGNAQVTLAISSAGVQTAALDAGTYAVWSTTDCFLKVGTTASDVTIGTGYPLYSAATPLTVIVPDQYKIGAITSSAIGTLSYHKVG